MVCSTTSPSSSSLTTLEAATADKLTKPSSWEPLRLTSAYLAKSSRLGKRFLKVTSPASDDLLPRLSGPETGEDWEFDLFKVAVEIEADSLGRMGRVVVGILISGLGLGSVTASPL